LERRLLQWQAERSDETKKVARERLLDSGCAMAVILPVLSCQVNVSIRPMGRAP
jgi:hypothetical protein